MMKTIIALGGSIESLPILRRAKEMGLRLVVVDGSRDSPGIDMADVPVVASCYHTDAVWELKKISGKFDAVICAAIDAPVVAAEVARALGLPGMSVEAAGLGADKYEQAKALRKSGVSVPDFEIFDIGDVYASFSGPDNAWNIASRGWSVVKPLDSRGARGVFRAYSGYWAVSWDRFVFSKSQSPTGRVMVEEWLDGPQLSTESLVQDGKVLFTAVGLRNYGRLDEFAPHVVEDGFDEPYNLYSLIGGEMTRSTAIIDSLIGNACVALGWFQSGGGVVKGDLVIHNGKLHIIELAPRLSGGLFCAAHLLCYGVDLIGAAINMALGYTIDAPKPYPRQFVSQRYLFPEPSWIGKRIVEQRIRILPQYHEFAHLSKPIGHVIQPVTAHPDRLGQALCVGATPQEARERAEAAVREMKNGMVVE